MIILIKLLLAHFIADFILQPRKWVLAKEQMKIAAPQFYAHLLVHGGLSGLLLWNRKAWLPILILVFVHGTIDLLKLYLQKPGNRIPFFIGDQLLHILSIGIIVHCWFDIGITLRSLLQNEMLWLYVTAVLFLTGVSNVIIRVLLTNWSAQLAESQDAALGRAGSYIGMLERLFTFIFIIIGQWSAVGFLMAAKSIFRFGDLRKSRDRKLTEYVLIGTFLSFGIAILIALGTLEISAYIKETGSTIGE